MGMMGQLEFCASAKRLGGRLSGLLLALFLGGCTLFGNGDPYPGLKDSYAQISTDDFNAATDVVCESSTEGIEVYVKDIEDGDYLMAIFESGSNELLHSDEVRLDFPSESPSVAAYSEDDAELNIQLSPNGDGLHSASLEASTSDGTLSLSDLLCNRAEVIVP